MTFRPSSRIHLRHALASIALLAAAGCTGLVGSGEGPEDPGLTPEELAAREMFVSKASPVLMQNCGGCHAGQRVGVEFLTGAEDMEIRDKLLTFEPVVVNLTAPASSRLLTKGAHDGPAFTATQLSDVLEWIRAEKDAQPDPGDDTIPLETEPFTPLICTGGTAPSATCPINTVDLTPLGIPGAKIEFVAQALGSALYLNQLKLIGGTNGAFIEHPLFVSWPAAGGEPLPDTIDRFFNVKMNLEANISEQIAGGTAAFVGFVATDKISIHFKTVKEFQPETPDDPTNPAGGGCKDLPSFKLNAQQLIQQSCASCHANANDASATSAMNIVGIASTDDTMIQMACNQVRTRVNLITPDQSGVFLAPDPANNNHPFRFQAAQLATFKNGPPGTGLLGWINAEKIAP